MCYSSHWQILWLNCSTGSLFASSSCWGCIIVIMIIIVMAVTAIVWSAKAAVECCNGWSVDCNIIGVTVLMIFEVETVVTICLRW